MMHKIRIKKPKWFLFLTLALSPIAVAVFDINNQDPSRADDAGKVFCVGDVPSFAYGMPRPPGSARTATLDQICAQSQYGGFPQPYNLELFCTDKFAPAPQSATEQRKLSLVARADNIDLDNVSKMSSRDKLEAVRFFRLLAYCSLRCLCGGIPFAQREPLGYSWRTAHVFIDLSRRDSKPADLIGRFELPAVGPSSLITKDWARALRVYTVSESDFTHDEMRNSGPVNVALARSNYLECSGPLPSFRLPDPVSASDYAVELMPGQEEDGLRTGSIIDGFPSPLLRLCGVALTGGDEEFNAGGYCHPSSTNPKLGEVRFADEMTPDLRWTFGSLPTDDRAADIATRQRALQLRYYCTNHCYCQNEDIQTILPAATQGEWLRKYLRMGAVMRGPGRADYGDSHSGSTTTGGTTDSSVDYPMSDFSAQRLEDTRGHPQGQGSCDVSCTSNHDCIERQQEQEQQQQQQPQLEEIQPAQPVCEDVGDTCIAQPTASGATRPNRSPSRLNRVIGGTISFFGAMCSSAKSRHKGPPGGGAGGRRRRRRSARRSEWGLEGIFDGNEEDEMYCPCNASYVSVGCCDSADGFIWEAAEAKIGELRI